MELRTIRITYQHIYDAYSESEMTKCKRAGAKLKKSSATKAAKDSAKVVWVKNDNCCLLYAMWETMTKQQQELLTVSDRKVLVVEIPV